MPSIQKRGDTYRIMVSLGYDMDGKQIRKTTTFTPPPDVTPGKGEKLAKAYAYDFEKHCQGMTNMNENLRFSSVLTRRSSKPEWTGRGCGPFQTPGLFN